MWSLCCMHIRERTRRNDTIGKTLPCLRSIIISVNTTSKFPPFRMFYNELLFLWGCVWMCSSAMLWYMWQRNSYLFTEKWKWNISTGPIIIGRTRNFIKFTKTVTPPPPSRHDKMLHNFAKPIQSDKLGEKFKFSPPYRKLQESESYLAWTVIRQNVNKMSFYQWF